VDENDAEHGDEPGDQHRTRQTADDVSTDELVRRHRPRSAAPGSSFMNRPWNSELGALAVRRVDHLEHNEPRDQELRIADAVDDRYAAAQCEAEDEDVEQRRDDRRPDHLVDDLEAANDLALD